jgi:anti-sigma regulatory factor (Ser/Thr protein kinase)
VTGGGSGEIFVGLARVADSDDVISAALDALLRLPGVRRVGLALTEGGGRRLRFTASDRDLEKAVDWCLIDAYDDVPLATVVRTGEPVLGALDALGDRYPDMVDRQRAQSVSGLAALPLNGSGPPLGGVVLFYERPQAFDAEQRAELLRLAADLADLLRRVQAAAPRQARELADLPVEPGTRVTHLVVAGEARAVGEARRHLRTELGRWGVDDDVADTAVLCLSELVTNAVIHTGAPSEVRATLDHGLLTVTVRDQGTSGCSPWTADDRLDPLRVHGRGLEMVGTLAARWGSELDSVGATVWFVLEVHEDEPHPDGLAGPGSGHGGVAEPGVAEGGVAEGGVAEGPEPQ